MTEIAGGILIAAGLILIVLPLSSVVLGLILSHVLNAFTPTDVISDAAVNFCMFVGFCISVALLYIFWP